jgi:cysteinyl-tRNA synthetase
LIAVVHAQERAFSESVRARDVTGAVVAILELESQIVAWSADIPGSDELDRAHASLRSMIVELGGLAEHGARDPRSVVGPFVESLLELRRRARDERRFADSDAVRDGLVKLGVEVRDTPSGTEWSLAEASGT